VIALDQDNTGGPTYTLAAVAQNNVTNFLRDALNSCRLRPSDHTHHIAISTEGRYDHITSKYSLTFLPRNTVLVDELNDNFNFRKVINGQAMFLKILREREGEGGVLSVVMCGVSHHARVGLPDI